MKFKQKKRRKIIGSVFILGLLFYVVALLWLVPPYLKKPINEQLKQNKLQLDYQRLWINPLTLNIHLNNAELKDLTGQEILSALKIDIDWQLWPLINQHIQIDHLFLEQANVHMIFNSDNQLMSPAIETKQSEPSQWQFNPGQVEVVNSSLTLHRQQQRLNINDINLKINLADLLDRQQETSKENALIQFETTPDGVFSIEQNANDNTFYWQLNDWPLQQISPWLTPYQADIELAGSLAATGSLQWPANKMPIIQIAETELTVSRINWLPFSADQTQINAREIKIDLNSQQIYIGHLTSPGGQLTLQIDPLDISNELNSEQTSNNNWQTQFDSISLSDWHITLQDNRPAFQVDIEQLSLKTESQQQNLTAQVKLTAPFNQTISINLNGQLSPIQLQGEVTADSLELAILNPWLNELSPWQIEQGMATVNSWFCVSSNGIFAQGQWSFPQMHIMDHVQRIVATETSLQSIGLNMNQKLLMLNNINSENIELYQLNPDNSAQATEDTTGTPQSTDQLWRVVIDDRTENLCLIKPL
ncbi:MAG: DUF748 domain-containing protein [Proteobacteria bacterium]|nr:DUF748 domain-containing protein [Pseudomonadota bacterium]